MKAMATKNKHAPRRGNCSEFKYTGHRLRELNFRIPPRVLLQQSEWKWSGDPRSVLRNYDSDSSVTFWNESLDIFVGTRSNSSGLLKRWWDRRDVSLWQIIFIFNCQSLCVEATNGQLSVFATRSIIDVINVALACSPGDPLFVAMANQRCCITKDDASDL